MFQNLSEFTASGQSGQDPAGLGSPACLQCQTRRLVGKPRVDDQTFQSRGRAALHAGYFGVRSPVDGCGIRRRLPGMSTPRRPGHARACPDGRCPPAKRCLNDACRAVPEDVSVRTKQRDPHRADTCARVGADMDLKPTDQQSVTVDFNLGVKTSVDAVVF